MKMRSLLLLLSLCAGLCVMVAMPRLTEAQTAPGTFVSAPVFTSSGLAFSVFTGGTTDQLEAAAQTVGASGVWVQDAGGTPRLLVVAGPTFLTQPFRAALPNGFPGPTAVTLTREAGATLPPATTTPAPSATPAPTPTPTTTPPVGSPSRAMGIYGDLRTESATKFAFEFTFLDTLPAIRVNASIAEQEVTYVRACRWSRADAPDLCTEETAPPTSSAKAIPKTYLFDLPPDGKSTMASIQLCNPRGCAEHVRLGVAVHTPDGALYAVGSPFSGSSRVRLYLLDPQIARVKVVYSDGLVGFDMVCSGAGACSGGNFDESTAPAATFQVLTRGGAVVSSYPILIRGTARELTAQARDAMPPGGPRVTATVPLNVSNSITSRGASVRSAPVQSLRQISGVTATRRLLTAVREVDVIGDNLINPTATSAILTLPRGAVVEDGTANLALLDPVDLTRALPPPPNTQFLMGAFVAAGPGQDLPFEKQVRLEFSLSTSTLPVGSTSRHLSTVFWDGARWVPASDAVLSNADGTMKANTWLTSQGFYALVCVVQP